jgi:L-malate glycosyltransferase
MKRLTVDATSITGLTDNMRRLRQTSNRESIEVRMKKASPAHVARPRLCFVGPMVGFKAGYVTTQGLILSNLFKKQGYDVKVVSSFQNRYVRLADIIRTLIRHRSSIDVLILEVYSGPSFVVNDIASWLGKCFGLPIIMWLHGGALPAFMARFPKWTRRVMARADAIIAPSPYLARAVAPYGFEAQVIPNIVDLSAYPYRHREKIRPRLFWMRSFHTIWNPLMAIRVLAHLRSIEPDASLVMAGQDKGLEAQARQLAEDLGLNGSVRFSGFLDGSGKAREGNASDIYINTNRIDNMPVAVVEACAMGLPVVTTDVGGIKDLLTDSDTGLLVPDNDDEAMVRAIKRLLYEPDLAGHLSAKGRELAERFSWEKVRPQWEQLFARLRATTAFNKLL